MATQRYISTSIWDDNWFIDELNTNERLFYFYLLTNEHTNIAGIYKVSIRKMASESCFSPDQVKKMLATFERTKKVYYREEHIIMVNWPKHQKWHKLEKIHKGIRAILINQVPPYLFDIMRKESIPYQYPIDSLSDGINSLPIGYLYDTNYLDSNLDSDSDIDSDSDSMIHTSLNDEKPATHEHDFAQFWSAYPRKIGKGAAEKSWSKIKMDDALFKTVLDAVESQKKSNQWKRDNGQYIPNPSTWLNQKRWEDELDGLGGTKTRQRPLNRYGTEPDGMGVKDYMGGNDEK